MHEQIAELKKKIVRIEKNSDVLKAEEGYDHALNDKKCGAHAIKIHDIREDELAVGEVMKGKILKHDAVELVAGLCTRKQAVEKLRYQK